LDGPDIYNGVRLDFASGAYFSLSDYAGLDDADPSSNFGDWVFIEAGAPKKLPQGVRLDFDFRYLASPPYRNRSGDALDATISLTKKIAVRERHAISPFVRLREMLWWRPTGFEKSCPYPFWGASTSHVLGKRVKLSTTVQARYDRGSFGKKEAVIADWKVALPLKLTPRTTMTPSYMLMGPVGGCRDNRKRNNVFGLSLAYSF
jgi:hypothetical protein